MASLSLRHIYKIYPGNVTAVKDVNIEIKDKEFIVLVGPSGCGKSTTLRMIAGLEEISKGELYIGDRLVNDIAPKDRDIAMVFQNYALYRPQGKGSCKDPRPEPPARPEAEGNVRWSETACCHGSCNRPESAGLPAGRTAF